MKQTITIVGSIILSLSIIGALIIMAQQSLLSTIICILLMVVFAVVVFIEHKKVEPIPFNVKIVFKILAVIGAGVVTFYLSKVIDTILAASLIGLTGGMLLMDYKDPVYVGAFVGMGMLFNIYLLLIVALIAGIIYVVVENHFEGVGGKLGMIAFMGGFILSFFVKNTLVFTIPPNTNYYIVILASILSALLTFYLNKYLDNTVMASSIVGLVIGVLMIIVPGSLMDVVGVVAYAATFIGMQTRYKFYYLPPAAAFIVYIYLQTKPFVGIGGGLGFSAFISLLPIIGIDYVSKGVIKWKKLRSSQAV